MWVRSLSLPPPHPLVLTGKGRSFLQPQLPPPPTETLSLSLCVLCVSRASQRPRLFAAFTADPCGGLSHRHWFLWSCAVLFSLFFPYHFGCGGDSALASWSTVFILFLQPSAWCCASVTLVMAILMAPTIQHTLTQVSPLHSFCMNAPLT